jgi:hypothetical protein
MESLAFMHGTVRVRTCIGMSIITKDIRNELCNLPFSKPVIVHSIVHCLPAVSSCLLISFCRNICCPYNSCEKVGCFLRYIGNKRTLLFLGEVVAKMDEDSDGVIRVEHVNKVTSFFVFIQCCGSGSGSGSVRAVCFWVSWIRFRIH